jgi:hypothetical protein
LIEPDIGHPDFKSIVVIDEILSNSMKAFAGQKDASHFRKWFMDGKPHDNRLVVNEQTRQDHLHNLVRGIIEVVS